MATWEKRIQFEKYLEEILNDKAFLQEHGNKELTDSQRKKLKVLLSGIFEEKLSETVIGNQINGIAKEDEV